MKNGAVIVIPLKEEMIWCHSAGLTKNKRDLKGEQQQ